MRHPSFRNVLHDSWLLKRLDDVRLTGNQAIHNNTAGDFSPKHALDCLQAVHDQMLNIEKQLWEYPYTGRFFEPVYEVLPEDDFPLEPEYRDIRALLNECEASGDAENAAKFALLLSDEDPDIPLTAFASALPEHTPIRYLIGMLTNPQILKARIDAGPYAVTSLVSRC